MHTSDVSGLYVHIPFCRTRCAYCAFYVTTRDGDRMQPFAGAVLRELDRYPGLTLRTIFLGGGTPSLLDPEILRTLCNGIRERCDVSGLVEWTIECNPATLSDASIEVLLEAGVNRFSVGAQSFDAGILKKLGRSHGPDDTAQTIQRLRRHGVTNVNLDLIAAVPGCDAAMWSATLARAVALQPEHVSVYALSLDEGAALERLAHRGRFALEADSVQLDVLQSTREALAREGYEQYEISNFARPGRACQHNVDCWRGEEYVGLGPSASSHVGLLRWTNAPDIEQYMAAVARGVAPPREEDPLTPALKRAERLVFGLRMNEGVPRAWAAGYENAVTQLVNTGLLKQSAERICLTARGKDLADTVGAELLAAMPADEK